MFPITLALTLLSVVLVIQSDDALLQYNIAHDMRSDRSVKMAHHALVLVDIKVF